MNKALSKAITQRAKSRNKFLKDPSAENNFSYNKKRNWCVSLLRKEKKKYFVNLNKKDITGNKTFGKLLNLSFQRKLNREEKLLRLKTKTWFQMMQK